MADARTHYRENAARGASAVRHVVMLYEQVVEDLRRAGQAMTENSIDSRTNAINHALVIIGALQSRLNFEAGGKVARHLERFYNIARRRLIDAQFHSSREILNEQITHFLNMRDAWIQVDLKEAKPITTPAPSIPTEAAAQEHVDGNGRSNWRA